MEARLPAHIEVGGLIRRVQAEGGFATVLHKGEPDAGTVCVVTIERGGIARAWERMPQADGTRKWQVSRIQDPENRMDFDDFLTRRSRQDPDLWIVELDIANGERFIGVTEIGG